MRPAAASQSSAEAFGLKPIAIETASTSSTASSVWIMFAITWPASTEPRQTAIVLKRATMPSVMSMATPIAVSCAPPTTVKSSMPGAR